MSGMTDAKTAIAQAAPDAVTVRGYDLTSELMGRLTLTEMFFLLLTGRAPDLRELRMTDACLVAIAEHGLVPSVQAARMTLSSAPEALQGAVAAGLLGCGSVILGATEYAGEMLRAGVEAGTSGEQIAREHREQRRSLPGFGHPLHKDGDPRTTRLLALSDELGVSGEHVALVRAIEAAVPDVYGRALPLNVSGAIAAPMLDLGLPAYTLKAIPLLARTAGLLGHLREEHERPIGFRLAAAAEDAVEYDG
jgi:citrate synthase